MDFLGLRLSRVRRHRCKNSHRFREYADEDENFDNHQTTERRPRHWLWHRHGVRLESNKDIVEAQVFLDLRTFSDYAFKS
jgi:hypothetical protein